MEDKKLKILQEIIDGRFCGLEYPLKIDFNDIPKELLRTKKAIISLIVAPVVDVSNISEETALDLIRNRKIPFYILCGNKCKVQLSRDNLEQIIDSQYFLSNRKVPMCGDGVMIKRKSKKGSIFFGCSRWPKCNKTFTEAAMKEYLATINEKVDSSVDRD